MNTRPGKKHWRTSGLVLVKQLPAANRRRRCKRILIILASFAATPVEGSTEATAYCPTTVLNFRINSCGPHRFAFNLFAQADRQHPTSMCCCTDSSHKSESHTNRLMGRQQQQQPPRPHTPVPHPPLAEPRESCCPLAPGGCRVPSKCAVLPPPPRNQPRWPPNQRDRSFCPFGRPFRPPRRKSWPLLQPLPLLWLQEGGQVAATGLSHLTEGM